MKRILAILVILAFTVSMAGCCTRMVAGKQTKSFGNCLVTAQDFVCNPPQTVKDMAAAAVPILVAVLNTLVPESAAWVNVQNAANTATAIQQGACVFVTDLNSLIALLQSDKVSAMQTKMLAAKKVSMSINPQAFVDWEVTNTVHVK